VHDKVSMCLVCVHDKAWKGVLVHDEAWKGVLVHDEVKTAAQGEVLVWLDQSAGSSGR
jgi:hypothetical protein